jgi:hypothetical protein
VFAIEVCDARGVRVVILALLYYFRIIVVEGATAQVAMEGSRMWEPGAFKRICPWSLGSLGSLPAFAWTQPPRLLQESLRYPSTNVLFRATASIRGLRTLAFPRLYTLQTATTSVMGSRSYHVDPWGDSPHYPHVGASMAGTNSTSAGEQVHSHAFGAWVSIGTSTNWFYPSLTPSRKCASFRSNFPQSSDDACKPLR